MSQNKRIKLNLEAASSSTSASNQKMSTRGENQQAAEPCKGAHGETEDVIEVFQAGETDFKKAVRWSGFVDKSLLIEELLGPLKEDYSPGTKLVQDAKYVTIFAPKRFGKSLNLNMVKCFLEVQKDREELMNNLKELENNENYKAFRRIGPEGKSFGEECEILKRKAFVKKHFGRYPIVHLVFKGIYVSYLKGERKILINKVNADIRKIIHMAYRAHDYLIYSNSLADTPYMLEQARATCETWCDANAYKDKDKNMDAQKGLQDLIEYLHNHHGSNVYVLVDEFDAPTVSALLAGHDEDTVSEINRLVTNLLGESLKGNVLDRCLQGALITGVSYLGSCGISTALNNFEYYKFLQNDRFVDYYGLMENELAFLLQNVIPADEQEDAKKEVMKRYNGYYYKGDPVYCLWSVLHYMRNYLKPSKKPLERKLNFWEGAELAENLFRILQHNPIMKDMLHLMGGGHIQFTPVNKVQVQELGKFFQVESDDTSKRFKPITSIAYTFLLEQGYFCLASNITPIDEFEIAVKIPNEEIKHSLKSIFQTYCNKTVGDIDVELKDRCVASVKNIPIDYDKSDPQKLLTRLYGSWNELFQIFKGSAVAKEVAMQAVLYCVMLRGNFKQCDPEKFFKVTEDSSGKLDLWIQREDGFSIICDLKYNAGMRDGNRGAADKTADRAYDEIINVVPPKKVSYASILDEQEIQHYLLIGLSMNGDCSVSMKCSVNSRDPEDSLSFPTTPPKHQESISSLPLDQSLIGHSNHE